jgi:regulatory protein
LNFLSYRIRSSQEIRKNLLKHNIDDTTIEAVLDRLEKASLVDDEDFAQQWVENRIQFKPRGKRALRSELYQKGISNEIIDEVLVELDEQDLAFACAQKYLAKLSELDEKAFIKKLSGHLTRRGFPYSVIKEVTFLLWKEKES